MLYQTLANIDKSQLVYRVLLTKNMSIAPELSEIERLEKKSPVLFNAFYEYILESIEERSEYRPIVPLFTSSSKPLLNLYKRTKNSIQEYYHTPLAYHLNSFRSSPNFRGSITRLAQSQKPLPIEPNNRNSNRNSEVIYFDPADDSEDNSSSKSIRTILKSPFASLFKKN